jgi:uncharacterized membrane protein YfcA
LPILKIFSIFRPNGRRNLGVTDLTKTFSKNAKRVVCGALVGLANGLFGGGGGMIAVPLLQKVGLSEREAHATAILLILPVCFLSFVVYALKGLYSLPIIIPTAIGVTAGGFLGAKLLGKIGGKTVTGVFSALQILAGVYMAFF